MLRRGDRSSPQEAQQAARSGRWQKFPSRPFRPSARSRWRSQAYSSDKEGRVAEGCGGGGVEVAAGAGEGGGRHKGRRRCPAGREQRWSARRTPAPALVPATAACCRPVPRARLYAVQAAEGEFTSRRMPRLQARRSQAGWSARVESRRDRRAPACCRQMRDRSQRTSQPTGKRNAVHENVNEENNRKRAGGCLVPARLTAVPCARQAQPPGEFCAAPSRPRTPPPAA